MSKKHMTIEQRAAALMAKARSLPQGSARRNGLIMKIVALYSPGMRPCPPTHEVEF